MNTARTILPEPGLIVGAFPRKMQMEILKQYQRGPRLIKGSGSVPGPAWPLVAVCTGLILFAIALKPESAADEYAHIADMDLEAFLAPAAGGHRDEEDQPRKTFSLRETMERRFARAR